MKLNARELRDLPEDQEIPEITRRPIYFILDNVLDTYNIGGLFRLADALAISKIYICGESEIPPNHKIKKASIGTYKIVPWEYCKTATQAIEQLRKAYVPSVILSDSEGSLANASNADKLRDSSAAKGGPQNDSRKLQIISIEQSSKSVPYTKYNYQLPVAFIVGNETTGVSKEALEASDAIVEIPMYGINKSLNVIVSTAIVAYHANKIVIPSE
jgi:tRNA G18 (ribose-2'-O)-methylase SpoU